MLFFSEKFEGPLAIRYPRGTDAEDFHPEPLRNFTLGQFEELSPGNDGYLYATGKMVQKAMKVRESLKEKGLDFGIINACFIKPIDTLMIRKHLDEGKTIITMEDNMVHGGFGSMVLETAMGNINAGHILNLGFDDTFVVQGSIEQLYEQYGLGIEAMTNKIVSFVGEKNE